MRKKATNAILISMSLLLSACATIVEGTRQSISVILSPEETTCIAFREGAQIANVSRTNRTMTVEKSRHDIILRCSAPGYQQADVKVATEASAIGVLGGGVVGLGVDYASGALNKYPNSVTVALVRQ